MSELADLIRQHYEKILLAGLVYMTLTNRLRLKMLERQGSVFAKLNVDRREIEGMIWANIRDHLRKEGDKRVNDRA